MATVRQAPETAREPRRTVLALLREMRRHDHVPASIRGR